MALLKSVTFMVDQECIELDLNTSEIRITDIIGSPSGALDLGDRQRIIDDMREFLILYDKANEKL